MHNEQRRPLHLYAIHFKLITAMKHLWNYLHILLVVWVRSGDNATDAPETGDGASSAKILPAGGGRALRPSTLGGQLQNLQSCRQVSVVFHLSKSWNQLVSWFRFMTATVFPYSRASEICNWRITLPWNMCDFNERLCPLFYVRCLMLLSFPFPSPLDQKA